MNHKVFLWLGRLALVMLFTLTLTVVLNSAGGQVARAAPPDAPTAPDATTTVYDWGRTS